MELMYVELSPYMTEFEIDQVIQFMNTLSTSKFDINPTIDDCETQLRLIIGSDRYDEIKATWKEKNQPLCKRFGTKKYRRRSDGTLWDGLDDTDNPNDYEIFYN